MSSRHAMDTNSHSRTQYIFSVGPYIVLVFRFLKKMTLNNKYYLNALAASENETP